MFKRNKKKNKTGLFAIIGLVLIIGFSALVSNLTAPEETDPVNLEFKTITYTEYEALFNKDNEGLVFVYVGRPGCSYCQKIKPLLKTLEEEEGIEFNYLNTDTMTEENFNAISTTSKAFEAEWGTPTLLAILNGENVSYVDGYREIEVLRSFVTEAKAK